MNDIHKKRKKKNVQYNKRIKRKENKQKNEN